MKLINQDCFKVDNSKVIEASMVKYDVSYGAHGTFRKIGCI